MFLKVDEYRFHNLHTSNEYVVDIGDIVAATALIASVITFIVSHLLAKKSDERRIQREEWLRAAQDRSEQFEQARARIEMIERTKDRLYDLLYGYLSHPYEEAEITTRKTQWFLRSCSARWRTSNFKDENHWWESRCTGCCI